MKPPAIFCLSVVTAIASLGQAGAETLRFELSRVKDGVYAAVAKPHCPMNCNVAVIVDDEDVIVVDSHASPSSATAPLVPK